MKGLSKDCSFDLEGKLVYKGVKLYIPRECLYDFSQNELYDFIESQYSSVLRYKRELILNKLI